MLSTFLCVYVESKSSINLDSKGLIDDPKNFGISTDPLESLIRPLIQGDFCFIIINMAPVDWYFYPLAVLMFLIATRSFCVRQVGERERERERSITSF